MLEGSLKRPYKFVNTVNIYIRKHMNYLKHVSVGMITKELGTSVEQI